MHSSPYWSLWLLGFAMTLLFEAPFALWFLRPSEPSLFRRIVLLIVANLVTHPLVWFFFPELPLRRLVSLLLSEGWAFGAEAFVYATLVTAKEQDSRALVTRAVVTSVVANGTSWGLGALLFWR
ncbi:MAG: hypothetical protein JW751_12525 [Polyangiaceae bacterium]|nr:hypothetical protein [Polyangiaceae bacterium]